jgi:hypothetical protein
MSRLPAETQAYRAPSPTEPWRGRLATPRQATSRGISTGWLIAGAVVVGLGALAWYYLGPDLKRYLKMERM